MERNKVALEVCSGLDCLSLHYTQKHITQHFQVFMAVTDKKIVSFLALYHVVVRCSDGSWEHTVFHLQGG